MVESNWLSLWLSHMATIDRLDSTGRYNLIVAQDIMLGQRLVDVIGQTILCNSLLLFPAVVQNLQGAKSQESAYDKHDDHGCYHVSLGVVEALRVRLVVISSVAAGVLNPLISCAEVDEDGDEENGSDHLKSSNKIKDEFADVDIVRFDKHHDEQESDDQVDGKGHPL